MTCVSIVTKDFTAFQLLNEVVFVYWGTVSKLDKDRAIFIFIIETVSWFILDGDFDQYLNNIKTLYKIQAVQEWVAKIRYSIFLTYNL